MMPNRCIFCGDLAELTSEHIWGEWIKDYVDLSANKHGLASVRVRNPGEMDEPTVDRRAGDALMAQVKVVCGACNTGFLSQLQDRARPHLIPLFDGERSSLDEAAQAIVSSWVAMATMTGAYSGAALDRMPISQKDRNWLRFTLTTPKHWRIWIGCCEVWNNNHQWLHATLPLLDAEDGPEGATKTPAPTNTQTTAFKIGSLYALSMSSDLSEFVAGWDWRALVESDAATFGQFNYRRAKLMLHEISPVRDLVVRWPLCRMSSADADEFAVAFFAYYDDLAALTGYID
jgi:hypothetical protein